MPTRLLFHERLSREEKLTDFIFSAPFSDKKALLCAYVVFADIFNLIALRKVFNVKAFA